MKSYLAALAVALLIYLIAENFFNAKAGIPNRDLKCLLIYPDGEVS